MGQRDIAESQVASNKLSDVLGFRGDARVLICFEVNWERVQSFYTFKAFDAHEFTAQACASSELLASMHVFQTRVTTKPQISESVMIRIISCARQQTRLAECTPLPAAAAGCFLHKQAASNFISAIEQHL
jgi:hypothetical protein